MPTKASTIVTDLLSGKKIENRHLKVHAVHFTKLKDVLISFTHLTNTY